MKNLFLPLIAIVAALTFSSAASADVSVHVGSNGVGVSVGHNEPYTCIRNGFFVPCPYYGHLPPPPPPPRYAPRPPRHHIGPPPPPPHHHRGPKQPHNKFDVRGPHGKTPHKHGPSTRGPRR